MNSPLVTKLVTHWKALVAVLAVVNVGLLWALNVRLPLPSGEALVWLVTFIVLLNAGFILVCLYAGRRFGSRTD